MLQKEVGFQPCTPCFRNTAVSCLLLDTLPKREQICLFLIARLSPTRVRAQSQGCLNLDDKDAVDAVTQIPNAKIR